MTTARQSSAARRRPAARWVKAAAFAVGALAMVGVGALGAAGWYYANVLRSDALDPDHSADRLDLTVIEAGDGTVTLAPGKPGQDGDWLRLGVYGLEWEGGYGQVGAIRSPGRDRVVRDFTPLAGAPRAGAAARIDGFAFPGDPMQAHGIPFREVTYRSEGGEFPAWQVEGTRRTAAIFVHGQGANRREALRMLPAVTKLGFPALVITYRNDEGVPPDESGFYRFGATEWRDLEAAAQVALDQGAEDLVLVGYSMGGSIVMSFLLESPLAARVRAAILDAPMLDFSATIDFRARERGAPAPVTAIGKRIAAWRFGVDWGRVDYLRRAAGVDLPILLFHGTGDKSVPASTSEAFARAHPATVRYMRVEGAGHVRSWNVDPASYEAEVTRFLTGIVRADRQPAEVLVHGEDRPGR